MKPQQAWAAVTMLVVRCMLLCLGLALPFLAQAQSLSELHQIALDTDPVVSGALAQVRAAEQRVVQAQAGMGPSAALALSTSETRYDEAPTFDLRRFSGKQATLQVTQPIFRASLVFALESAQAQLEQAQAALAQARAEATSRFLESAFDVLKSRDALALVEAQKIAAEEQLAQARQRFKVGTVSIIDVREAEGKIDTVAAQALAAGSDLELKQQLLGEIVGRPIPDLLNRGLNGDHLPQLSPGGVLEWIADAQLRNPQLAGARQALLAAEAELRKAWQGHAPTADLTYNYTINSDTGTVTSIFPRRGNASQVGLNVTIPLFASGATQAKVKEAMALRDKAQSDVDVARRTVQTSIRQAFSAALSSAGLARGLETATHSLETAMHANQRGYEVGLKVNSEVLEAQSRVFESRRDLSRARYEAWFFYSKLKAFAGRLSDADVAELDGLLVRTPMKSPRGRLPARSAQP